MPRYSSDADGGYSEYCRLFRESQGFDVNPKVKLPRQLCGGIKQFTLLPRHTRLRIIEAAVFALEQFNRDNNSDLQFDRLVKANGQIVGGFMYYITFKASSLHPRRLITYQAKVWRQIGDTLKVMIFREKPRPASKNPNSIPMGAFLCFRNHVAKIVQASHGKKAPLRHITSLASRVWRSMSTQEKLRYYNTRSLKYEDVAQFESVNMRKRPQDMK